MSKISDFIAGRTPPELYETYLTPGLFAPWAEDFAAFAEPGGRYLDIACGTGAVSRAIAGRLEDNVSIKAVDVAPLMIEAARRYTRTPAVEFELASADALPFDDASFDGAFCQQGLQFFPDKEKAFQEARRVIKPGGFFAASVWLPVEESSPVFRAFADSIARHLGEDLLPLGPFSFGDAERLRARAEEAGFKIDSLERRTKQAALPGIEDLVLFDFLFLGRPGPEGALQPIFKPDDPAGDAVVDKIVADMTVRLGEYVNADGTLSAPMTAAVQIARAP